MLYLQHVSDRKLQKQDKLIILKRCQAVRVFRMSAISAQTRLQCQKMELHCCNIILERSESVVPWGRILFFFFWEVNSRLATQEITLLI
jgi:hypothetical protein